MFAARNAFQTGAAASGDPYWTSVLTLLHGEGSNGSNTITDSSSFARTWNVTGAVQISTAAQKFGSSSISFPGTASYLTFASASTLNIGTGDYTVEGWINMIATTGTYQVVMDMRTNANFYLLINSSGVLTGFTSTGGTITLSAGVWTHFALCRSSGTLRLFVNGVQSGSNYTDSTSINPDSGSSSRIGYDSGNAFPLYAYLDDFRVTKAARYTTTFTPPTATFLDK